jgi:hypothetical protein
MFGRPNIWCSADRLSFSFFQSLIIVHWGISLIISLGMLGTSSWYIRCLGFWSMAYRQCSDNFTDRCSESSAPMPVVPLQLTMVPCRSKYDSLLTSWSVNDCHRCKSICIVCYPRLVTDWIPQAGLYGTYGIGWVLLYIQFCGVSLALARPQWYWLNWNIVQVIIVARLYAMYQGSRKILIFLIVTCLAVIIYGSIVVTMETMDTLGGAFNCGWKQMCMGLIDEYQRNSFFLAPMCAQYLLAMGYLSQFCCPWFGYSPLRGRSSHCVLHSGLL